jgi:hypothetical protein
VEELALHPVSYIEPIHWLKQKTFFNLELLHIINEQASKVYLAVVTNRHKRTPTL